MAALSLRIRKTSIPSVLVVHPQVHGDQRGFFMETWNEKAFSEAGQSFRSAEHYSGMHNGID